MSSNRLSPQGSKMEVRLKAGYATCWGASGAQSAAWQRVIRPTRSWDGMKCREKLFYIRRRRHEGWCTKTKRVKGRYLWWSRFWRELLSPCRLFCSAAAPPAGRPPVWGWAPAAADSSPASQTTDSRVIQPWDFIQKQYTVTPGYWLKCTISSLCAEQVQL